MAEERRLVVVGREEPILVEPKISLLEALQRAGVTVLTSCGGVATCGLCRITVLAGGECLTELRSVEEHHLGNVASIVGLRLACQTRVARAGEVRVEVPPVEDLHERRKRKLERARSGEQESKPEPRGRAPRVEWRPRVLASVPGEPARGEGAPAVAPSEAEARARASKRPVAG